MIPINLKAKYGKRYKIKRDEGATQEVKGRADPWYWQIPCPRGHIYPISDTHMGFWCDGTVTKGHLRRAKVTMTLDGDTEAVFKFTPDQFETVAKIVKPLKKRQVSAEQREAFKKRMETYRKNLRNA